MAKDMKTDVAVRKERDREGGREGLDKGQEEKEDRCSAGQEETRKAKKHNQNTVAWVSSFVRGCVTSGYLPELRCKAPPRPAPAGTPLNAAPLVPPDSCPRRWFRHTVRVHYLG